MTGRTSLFEQCAATLDDLTGGVASAEPLAFFVPGRIEVLGKHTDYAGGRSLLCAVDRGFAVLVRPRDDGQFRVVDAIRRETRHFTLTANEDAERGDWSVYVSTVARRVSRDFPAVRRGADLAFASDLPAASGMSSSSALVIAIFLSLHAVNDLDRDPLYRRVIGSREDLGGYLGAVENGRVFGPLAGDRGVGTIGGSQDQTAILCCREGVLSRYAFLPVRAEGVVPFPATHAFVVAYSGVAAEKTSAAMLRYNEASLAAVRILDLWSAASKTPFASLGHAIASDAEAADRIRAVLRRAPPSTGFTPQRLLERFDQFAAETFQILPSAADALARGDLGEFGTHVDRSQHNAERLLGNQIPETVLLQRSARELGANAASAFGAGFGGSVWALTPRDGAEQFALQWSARYHAAFPVAAARAEFIITTPGSGAARL